MDQILLRFKLVVPFLEQEIGFRNDADREALLVDDRNRADPVLLDEADQELEGSVRTGDVDAARHDVRYGSVARQAAHNAMRSAIRTGRSVDCKRS